MKRLAALYMLVPAVAVVWSGCTVGPKYRVPSAPVPTVFKETGPDGFKEIEGWRPGNPQDNKIRQDWWVLFGDPQLNALEAQVDVSNQNLKNIEALFRAARAQIRYNRSALFPTITVVGDVGRNRVTPVQVAPGGTQGYGEFELPFDLSYEVDAWGRIRRSIAAAREEAQASAGDIETLRLSLHAELAYDYFEVESADAQKRLLDNTVQTYERALDLTTNRYRGGVATVGEVAQARAQLNSARTLATDTGVQRAQYEHAIAVLVGKPPAELTIAFKPLDTEPPTIPIGLPSQLLERRPDIASAERRVANANEQIGIARAAYFPQIVLTATGGFLGHSIVDWLSWPNRFWAVGPGVLQTIFDAGRRRATTETVVADYDAQVASYRQTALAAFQQVEDNLVALRLLDQETETARSAVTAADKSLEISTNRYKGGLITYLDVVTAQNIALENKRTAVDILRRRMDASVLLIKALGGGWDRTQLPNIS